jgi:hypothetical protein
MDVACNSFMTIDSAFPDMAVGTEVVTLSSYIGTVAVSMQLLLA